MTPSERDLRRRIADLVESVGEDQLRTRELFQYLWTMMCVDRGLLRVVREERQDGVARVVVEEAQSRRRRTVVRPPELDDAVEGLAVQALAQIIGATRRAS